MPINTKDYISSDDKTVGELFLHNRLQFHVPLNQRPWSWTPKRIEDLWDDIKKTTLHFHNPASSSAPFQQKTGGHGDPHFIGTFLFEEVNNELYEIVDGQQRFTAITMIITVLRDITMALSIDPSLTAQQRHSLQTVLQSNLTDWIEANPLVPEDRPRLLVDDDYKELFLAIVRNTKQTERQNVIQRMPLDFSERRNHRHLYDTFIRTYDFITTDFSRYAIADRYSLLTAVTRTMASHFLCIETVVRKPAFALEVFKSLNAKMTPLSDVDKIKNELFLKAPSSDHPDIKKAWGSLYMNVPKGDIGIFLRNRHEAIFGPCPKTKLYEHILSHEFPHSTSTLPLINSWVDDSKFVQRVTLKEPFYKNPNTLEALQDLIGPLRISLSQILLLSAAKTFTGRASPDFEKAAVLTRNVCFRAITVMQADTDKLANALGEAARGLLAKGQTLSEISEALERRFSDRDFEDAFARLSITRSAVQFYILERIERHLGSAAGVIPRSHSASQHIEHIMPVRFSNRPKRISEWSHLREQPDEHKRYLNRIGNLLILEGDINKHVSNYDLHAKQTGAYPTRVKGRKAYLDSALSMPKSLADTSAFPRWDFASIDARQEALAKLALKIWPVRL